MKRPPIKKRCNHNILSDSCSLQPIIKPKYQTKEEMVNDKTPNDYCPVCKKYFYD